MDCVSVSYNQLRLKPQPVICSYLLTIVGLHSHLPEPAISLPIVLLELFNVLKSALFYLHFRFHFQIDQI